MVVVVVDQEPEGVEDDLPFLNLLNIYFMKKGGRGKCNSSIHWRY